MLVPPSKYNSEESTWLSHNIIMPIISRNLSVFQTKYSFMLRFVQPVEKALRVCFLEYKINEIAFPGSVLCIYGY